MFESSWWISKSADFHQGDKVGPHEWFRQDDKIHKNMNANDRFHQVDKCNQSDEFISYTTISSRWWRVIRVNTSSG